MRAWQRLDRYDPRWRFSTWLFTVAARRAVSLHRQQRRRATEDLPDDMDSGELEPGQQSSRREQRENLWDLAARVLSRDQLSALWLRYAEDLSPGEIGEVLGRGASSTRVVLYRARQVLARHLPAPLAEDGPSPAAPARTGLSPAPLPRTL